MHYTVYKVTNRVDGKTYIGTHKTKNLNDGYLGSGKYLKRAIEKHGAENFTKEILFDFDNPQEMFEKESKLVNEDFLTLENTYNLKLGGSGGWKFVNDLGLQGQRLNQHLTDEKRSQGGKKGYKALKRYLEENPELVRKNANRASSFFLGHTKESRSKIGESNKKYCGKNSAFYGTSWITDGIFNKRITSAENVPAGWKKGKTQRTSNQISVGPSSELI